MIGLIGVAFMLKGFDVMHDSSLESQALLIIGATLMTLGMERRRSRKRLSLR